MTDLCLGAFDENVFSPTGAPKNYQNGVCVCVWGVGGLGFRVNGKKIPW